MSIFRLQCKRCGDMSTARESKDSAIVTADRRGWCITDKRHGVAVCPKCQEEVDTDVGL